MDKMNTVNTEEKTPAYKWTGPDKALFEEIKSLIDDAETTFRKIDLVKEENGEQIIDWEMNDSLWEFDNDEFRMTVVKRLNSCTVTMVKIKEEEIISKERELFINKDYFQFIKGTELPF